MKKTEEKRHFEWTKSRIAIAVLVFVLLASIWYLELNGIVNRLLFYISSFAVIVCAFLTDYFFVRKKQ
jgi:membrane-bound metal-dependent hydrolase YbcI (DUF457 family)